MSLGLYDSSQVLMPASGGSVTDPLRTVHNGRNGGAYETKMYIRNSDPAVYYHGITISYTSDPGIDSGVLGNSGWSIKLSKGERQPTEAEWDQVTSGSSIPMADIGASGSPDTSTYYPFWVRVYCPGETAAQLRSGQTISVNYLSDAV